MPRPTSVISTTPRYGVIASETPPDTARGMVPTLWDRGMGDCGVLGQCPLPSLQIGRAEVVSFTLSFATETSAKIYFEAGANAGRGCPVRRVRDAKRQKTSRTK